MTHVTPRTACAARLYGGKVDGMTTNTSQRTRYAKPGAVRSQNGGSLPIRACNTCNEEIVWCKSARTGNFYPVNVRHTRNDAAYYQGNDLHRCDPEVTIYAVVYTECGHTAVLSPTESEAESVGTFEMMLRIAAKCKTAESPEITEIVRMRYTTRHRDLWLSPGWTPASSWLANAETIERQAFGS